MLLAQVRQQANRSLWTKLCAFPLGFAILRDLYTGSGIGRDASISYALEGVRVLVLADIDRAAVEETRRQCEAAAPERVGASLAIHVLEVDVTDEGSVERMVQEAVAKAGRLDYCVGSAGVSHGSYPWANTCHL